MKWLGFTVSVAGVFLFSARFTYASVHALSPSGVELKWPGPPKLNLVGNPVNSSGISAADFRASVIRGLQRWQEASNNILSFDYWQGTDTSVYIPNSELNGRSSIYFASNSNDGGGAMSPTVLGLTQVWYDANTGEILEADTELNDVSFHFTLNPTDTSGAGAGGIRSRNVFLDNVVTHELGHSFGLSHSGVSQSTMIYIESPEIAHLGCDDITGIRGLYSQSSFGFGAAISGTVVSEAGAPVFGAQVSAISRRRGTVLGASLSDSAGHFAIGGLEAGTYALMIEPFYSGAATISQYYSAINPDICAEGAIFRRSLATDSAGAILAVHVGNMMAGISPIVARCSPIGSQYLPTSDANGTLAAGSFESSGEGTGSETALQLPQIAGHAEIRAMDYSLYSPVTATPELLTSSGVAAPATVSSTVYTGDSGYIDFDSELEADGLAQDAYVLQMTSRQVGSSYYPAGSMALDSDPFVVVTASYNEGAPADPSIPFNPRCRMAENFSVYISPVTGPPLSNDQGASGSVGFCGTVGGYGSEKNGHSVRNGAPIGIPALVGWLLPWLMMLSIQLARVVRRS